MKPSSAAPTLKQLAEMLRAAIGYIGGDEDDEVEASKRIAKVIAALEAAPPAAERTALKELREKAERLRSSAPNLSIAGNIVIPRADIEKGKAFVLMNREEYWGRIKSIREKIYGDAQERAGANTP